MRIVKVSREEGSHYVHHGVGHTEHDGYGGTADNGWSFKQAIACEVARCILPGETYMVQVNGVEKGTFTKSLDAVGPAVRTGGQDGL